MSNQLLLNLVDSSQLCFILTLPLSELRTSKTLVIYIAASGDNLVVTYSQMLRDVFEEMGDAEVTRSTLDGGQLPALDWAGIEVPGNLL